MYGPKPCCYPFSDEELEIYRANTKMRSLAMLKKRKRIAGSGLLFLLILSGISSAVQDQTKQIHRPDVVYVGTPYDVISIMLEMARVGKEDVLFDLGCGDGRVVILAAQKYGCRGTGYEIDPLMVQTSKANVLRNRLDNRVKIVQADIFTLDLSKATVVLLYLNPDANRKLLPQLYKMKPGARVICHNYDLPGIVEDQTLTYLSNEDNTTHIMTLYIAPLKRMDSTNTHTAASAPASR
jgi:SAM-dependent methyltransferase